MIDNNGTAEFRGTEEGIKLCADTFEECTEVVIKKSDGILTDVQQFSLMMETGSHMIVAGAYALAMKTEQRPDKMEQLAATALEMTFKIAMEELKATIARENKKFKLQ